MKKIQTWKMFTKLADCLTPKRLIAGIFFALVIGYAGYRSYNFLLGPSVRLRPPSSLTLSSPLVTIEGQTARISHLYLNDNLIYTDEDGHFEEKLLLAPGYSIIKLEARDRFGRSIKRLLPLVYNEGKN